jgi:hypothetical protein
MFFSFFSFFFWFFSFFFVFLFKALALTKKFFQVQEFQRARFEKKTEKLLTPENPQKLIRKFQN